MMGLNTNNYRNARTLLSENISSLCSSMQPQKSFRLYGSTVRPWNSVPKHDLQFKLFRPISHTLVKTKIIIVSVEEKSSDTNIERITEKKDTQEYFFVFNDQESKF